MDALLCTRAMLCLSLNDWINNMVSAIISTLLALLVSWAFYHAGNRKAFKVDIMAPIYGKEKPNEIVNILNSVCCRYSFRYSHKKEKTKIGALYEAAEKCLKHTFEKAFYDAIVNYAYSVYKIDRFHVEFIEEIGTSNLACSYDEICLKKNDYSKYLHDNDYDSEKLKELTDNLHYFFEQEIGVSEKRELFIDKTITEVFYESKEYREYESSKERFLDALEDVKSLRCNKKLFAKGAVK